MSTTRHGQNDAQSGKPMANQNGWTTAQRDNYNKGYQSGKR